MYFVFIVSFEPNFLLQHNDNDWYIWMVSELSFISDLWFIILFYLLILVEGLVK